MANIKNFGMQGVSSDVQFGKGGNRLVSNSGVFSVVTAAGAPASILIANATQAGHAVSLGQLDAVKAAAQAADLLIQNELDATQAGAGLSADGSYVAPAGSTYLGSATSLTDADKKLDAAIVAEVAQRVSDIANASTRLTNLEANATSSVASLAAEVDAIEAAVGLNTDGTFAALSGTYVATATSIKSALEALDAAQVAATADAQANAVAQQAAIAAGIADAQANAATQQAAIDAAIAAQIANAVAQQTTIDQNAAAISNEIARATTKEGDLQTQISNEVVRASDAEAALANSVAIETVRAQGQEALLSNAITNEITRAQNAEQAISDDLDGEIARAKASEAATNANVAALTDRVTALGSVFNYAGTLDGTALDLDALPSSGKDVGDYYKITGDGPLTFTYNAGADSIVLNKGDGVVKSSTGWDKIDNTNSVVRGTADFVTVTGSTDTGFDVTIADTFKNRLSAVESATSVDSADLQNQIDALRSNAASYASTQTGIDNAQNAALAMEANARASGDTLNAQAITDEANARTAADTLLTNNLASAISAYQAADATLQAEIDTVNAAYIAADTVLRGKIDDETASRTAAVAAANAAIQAEVTRATAAEGALNANVANVASAFAAADSAIQAELDATQAGAGLAANGDYVANASGNYISGATSLKDADDKLDASIRALANSLANHTQDEIHSAANTYAVKTTDSAVEFYGDNGGIKTLFANAVTGSNQNATITFSTAVAGEVRMEAHSATASDVDIRLVPQGDGQVIVGDTGTDGVIQADNGHDLTLAGGDNASGNGGQVVIAGGRGSNTDGSIVIKNHIDGQTIADFSGANAASNLTFSGSATSVTVGAAGSASNLDVVLAPKGTGRVDASGKKIVNVATGTESLDAVNVGQLNAAVSAAQSASKVGSVRSITTANIGNTNGLKSIDSRDNGATSGLNGVLLRVKVVVTSVYASGATLTIKTGSNVVLASSDLIDEQTVGMYLIDFAQDINDTLYVEVNNGGTAQGSAKVVVEYEYAADYSAG